MAALATRWRSTGLGLAAARAHPVPAETPPPPTAGQMKKMIKSTKFPAHFETKVDMKKVNLDVMLPWITEQVSEYLGFEDEVVIGYVESQLRETDGALDALKGVVSPRASGGRVEDAPRRCPSRPQEDAALTHWLPRGQHAPLYARLVGAARLGARE